MTYTLTGGTYTVPPDYCLYIIPGSDNFVNIYAPKERSRSVHEWITKVRHKNLPLEKSQEEFDKWYDWRAKLLKDITSTLKPLIK